MDFVVGSTVMSDIILKSSWVKYWSESVYIFRYCLPLSWYWSYPKIFVVYDLISFTLTSFTSSGYSINTIPFFHCESIMFDISLPDKSFTTPDNVIDCSTFFCVWYVLIIFEKYPDAFDTCKLFFIFPIVVLYFFESSPLSNILVYFAENNILSVL